jgi:hypothetical protein
VLNQSAIVAFAWLLPLMAAEAHFREHTVATGLRGGYQVVVGDLNHDGRPDLIALASGMPELVWFENPGWERHVIAGGMNRMINLTLVASGSDPIPDIVLACEFSMEAKNSIGRVLLLEHQGDPRQPWSVRELDRLPTSHRLRTANIDGSGTKVVVSAPLTAANAAGPLFEGHVPLVYYRAGEWKRQLAGDENEGVMHGIFITDWDRNGRDAILTASFSGIHLYRLADGRWSRLEIAKGNAEPCPRCGSSDATVVHIGKERLIASIEPWHGNQVVAYHEREGVWVRNVIDDTLIDGHTLQAADLDGDGNDEIIAGYRGAKGSGGIVIYRENKGRWLREPLDTAIAAASCAVADLNGDRRLDIACIGSATADLKWYENVAR